MRGGSEPDGDEPGAGVAEARDPAPPIGIEAELAFSLPSHFLSVPDEPGTSYAPNDLRANFLERVDHVMGRAQGIWEFAGSGTRPG
jgi:hypothetical protein